MRKIRGYLKGFLHEHESWIVDVGGEFLAKKGLDFNEWAKEIVGNYMPMDELALLCIARLWHRHFAVIMKDYVWTTGIGIPIDDCCVVFAYCGGLLLRDTVKLEELMHLPLYQTLYGAQEDTLDLSVISSTANLETNNVTETLKSSANLSIVNTEK